MEKTIEKSVATTMIAFDPRAHGRRRLGTCMLGAICSCVSGKASAMVMLIFFQKRDESEQRKSDVRLAENVRVLSVESCGKFSNLNATARDDVAPIYPNEYYFIFNLVVPICHLEIGR